MKRFTRRAQPAGTIFPEIAPIPAEEETVDPGPDPSTQNEGVWAHGVAFGADGWFHPMTYDEHGNELGPDLERKLIHNADQGQYEFAKPEHRDHKSYWETKHPEGREIDLIGGDS